MSRDKQISELAKVLNECCNNYDENGNHLGNKCYGCECWSSTNGVCCSYNTKEATHLYNAGYRKASEVAEEIFGEIITTIFKTMPPNILLVGKDADFTDGVRFGKREAILDMINNLAELKKKYTEEK